MRAQTHTRTHTALRQSSSAKPPPTLTHPPTHIVVIILRESCRQTEEPVFSPTACSTSDFALLYLLCVCPLLSMHECACECARDGACPATPRSSAHPFTEKKKKSCSTPKSAKEQRNISSPPKKELSKTPTHTHTRTDNKAEGTVLYRCSLSASCTHE